MKEAIIGYVTGVINGHQREIEGLLKARYTPEEITEHQDYVNELSDLLTFVEDSKEEESQSSETIYSAGQYESLGKQIEQYKECLHNGDAERIRLRGINDKLESEATGLSLRISAMQFEAKDKNRQIEKLNSKITEWEKNNSKQMQKIEEFRKDNIAWQNACIDLKNKLEKLEGIK